MTNPNVPAPPPPNPVTDGQGQVVGVGDLGCRRLLVGKEYWVRMEAAVVMGEGWGHC